MATKRAVVVGVDNYFIIDPTGNNNLVYCVNDARAMARLLRDVFGFTEIYLYENLRASRSRIMRALRHIISISETGDSICFFFAGHGDRVRAELSEADCDLYYEALVPASEGVITDRDLAELTADLYPDAVNFTVITDACHSGGLHLADKNVKCRSLFYSNELLQAISSFLNTLIPCGLCLTPDSSALSNNISNVRITNNNTIDLDPDPDKTLVAACKSTLLSACRFDEYAWTNLIPGQEHGIFTQAILETINHSGYSASYHDTIDQLIPNVRQKIASQYGSGVSQTPQLFGQRNRMDESLLAGWTFTPVHV